jgi:hypothetical protein
MSIVLSSSTSRVSISACSVAFNKVSTVYHLVLERKREKLPLVSKSEGQKKKKGE